MLSVTGPRHLRTQVFILAAIVAWWPMLAAAQLFGASGPYSFSDSAAAAADYTQVAAKPKTACNRLRAQGNFGYSVISAEVVPANGGIPEYCRVEGVIVPEIKFQISLPTGWNGRLYQQGNGGFGGHPLTYRLQTLARDNALKRNFVVVFATTGHDLPQGGEDAASDGSFAFNNFIKHVDYAFRAPHLVNVAARELVGAYYRRAPAHAYWDGCSTGGRQGHVAAQRYPDDFDGILAGAGVIDFIGTFVGHAWYEKAWREAPIDVEKLAAVVGPRVYAKCDAIDGLTDRLISNPKACRFDPLHDLPICEQSGKDCLTPAEAQTLSKIYGGPLIDGKPRYYGFPPGGEAPNYRGSNDRAPLSSNWAGTLFQPDGSIGGFHARIIVDYFRYLAFPADDPTYDWHAQFKFSQAEIDQMDLNHRLMDGNDPDLRAFRERGGKMIAWHGWHDMSVPPDMSIAYYEQARAFIGEDLDNFYRLFMVPGMNHCGQGNGLNKFDGMTALIDWVENGVVPHRITAEQTAGPDTGRTRPLCPYPQVAKYKGSGDVNLADSFVCASMTRENATMGVN